eukprot:1183941-Prorocentrum_minimum.AAC.1
MVCVTRKCNLGRCSVTNVSQTRAPLSAQRDECVTPADHVRCERRRGAHQHARVFLPSQHLRYILTMDQSDAGKAWVYSHDGPIRRRKRGYILTMDQSDAGKTWVYSRDGPISRRKNVGIFSRWTNPTQGKRGYILMTEGSLGC